MPHIYVTPTYYATYLGHTHIHMSLPPPYQVGGQQESALEVSPEVIGLSNSPCSLEGLDNSASFTAVPMLLLMVTSCSLALPFPKSSQCLPDEWMGFSFCALLEETGELSNRAILANSSSLQIPKFSKDATESHVSRLAPKLKSGSF